MTYLPDCYCPMGCGRTLHAREIGDVTCGSPDCPRPNGATELLQVEETEHVVTFTSKRFGILHPLRERLDVVDYEGLEECELHKHLYSLDGPPVPAGRYQATGSAEHGWLFEAMPR